MKCNQPLIQYQVDAEYGCPKTTENYHDLISILISEDDENEMMINEAAMYKG